MTNLSTYSLPQSTEETPVVFTKDGQVFANSRDVADYFGKSHHNLLRQIDVIAKDGTKWGQIHFDETHYVHSQNGQQYRYYDMTKDGFIELVMGFTGAKAREMKRAYIKRFNAMEEFIRYNMADVQATITPAIPQSFAEALRLAADQQEQIENLNGKLEEAEGDRFHYSIENVIASHSVFLPYRTPLPSTHIPLQKAHK